MSDACLVSCTTINIDVFGLLTRLLPPMNQIRMPFSDPKLGPPFPGGGNPKTIPGKRYLVSENRNLKKQQFRAYNIIFANRFAIRKRSFRNVHFRIQKRCYVRDGLNYTYCCSFYNVCVLLLCVLASPYAIISHQVFTPI